MNNKKKMELYKNFVAEKGSIFSKSQFKEIKNGFLYGFVEGDIVELYAKPEFSPEQMDYIFYAINSKVDEEKVSIIANTEFSPKQMKELCFGATYCNIEQFKIVANKDFNPDQMYWIIDGFKSGFSIEQVKIYADPRYTSDQMKEILFGYIFKLSIGQVSMYANPDIPAEKMSKKREYLYSIVSA